MTEALADLKSMLTQLTPTGVSFAALAMDAQVPPLLAAEARCVSRAVPSRQREFAVGRWALRLAIAKAGADLAIDQPILVGPSREPLLPAAIGVSLAHTAEFCVAIATLQPDLAIGIDIERLNAHRPQGFAQELQPYRARDDLGGLLPFAAKEAVYKSQFRFSRQLLGFQDAALVVRGDHLRARLGCGQELRGRWGLAAGHVIAITWRNAPPASLPSD